MPTVTPANTAESPLALLRQTMRQQQIDAYLVPRSDEHQGEYVPPSAMRLAWLTGFTGSAGIAVAMRDQAALFIDGRYTLQARIEVDGSAFSFHHLVTEPPHEWLSSHLKPGEKLGYDPWLLTPAIVERLKEACRHAGAELVAVDGNLVDRVWRDRPAPPKAPITPHPLDFAGKSSADKRADIAAEMKARGQAAAFLSAPDSVAWLLNVRGGDVPFAPLPLCFALLRDDATVDLFVDPVKLSPGLKGHLGPAVRLAEPNDIGTALDELAGRRVRLDPTSAPAWAADRLAAAGATLAFEADPCLLPKACKTEAEMEGTRKAHHRDGVALAGFLAWLAREGAGHSESAVADKLEEFRKAGALYRGPSFPTIAGAGPNGAIVHYHVTPGSDRVLEAGQLFLLDSGGQYLDGTTDITRTIAIGAPGTEERHRFTLVLKGHIALARARFPKGTTGSQLDVLARAALWAEGLDFDHGTGHGVGSYLSVHEGPQRISKAANAQALLPGMIISNEPGYYKTDAYGIRIENLVAVRLAEGALAPSTLEFETLTLAPIDRALIEAEILNEQERAWVDAYHARVFSEIAPQLDPATADWLKEATRPL